MESLYVLQLQGGKYYVGKSADVKNRIEQHMAGSGSAWTKQYRPVKVVETRRLKDEHDENNTTKDYMKKYGIDNVRGGSYCQLDLPASLQTTLVAELRGASDACFKCGKTGHFARYCRAAPPPPTLPEFAGYLAKKYLVESKTCYRCGRTGHYKTECYTYTNVDGEYIGRPARDPRRDWSDDDDSDDDSDD